jgi:hypothetical protein
MNAATSWITVFLFAAQAVACQRAPQPPGTTGQHTAPASSGRLALILRSEKRVYRRGEHLRLWLIALNRGPRAILLGDGPTKFFITDRRGRHVPYPYEDCISDYPPLMGRESFNRFEPGTFTGYIARHIRLRRPGTYFMRASMTREDYSDQLGFTMWHGTITSNRIVVSIR